MSKPIENTNQMTRFLATRILTKNLELQVAMELLKSEEESLEIGKLSKKLNINQAQLLETADRVWEAAGIKGNRAHARIFLPAGEDRLKLAVATVTLGATVEETTSILTWKEFEAFCAKVLEENGYACTQEFRFKSIQRKRFECDILAARKPLILMADCKHYAGRVKGLRAVVEKQIERVSNLCKSVPTMIRSIPEIVDWSEAFVIPVIITLFPENPSIMDDVPVVPSFKLNQLIQELPSNTEKITHLTIYPSRQEKLPTNKPK
jgi:hypothetical protein